MKNMLLFLLLIVSVGPHDAQVHIVWEQVWAKPAWAMLLLWWVAHVWEGGWEAGRVSQSMPRDCWLSNAAHVHPSPLWDFWLESWSLFFLIINLSQIFPQTRMYQDIHDPSRRAMLLRFLESWLRSLVFFMFIVNPPSISSRPSS